MVEHVLDSYGTQLYLCTQPRDWKRLRKIVEALKHDVPDSAGQVTSLIYHRKRQPAQLVVVIWINKRQHDNSDLGELLDTCAHEASHAAGRILEHAGHDTPATDEPHAYLCGWLTRWIWQGCDAGLS